jgi:glycosyl-4,4'-diaponeurosporenoate acyltransferase
VVSAVIVEARGRTLIAVNVVAWAAIHSASGYAASKLPDRWLRHDRGLLRRRPFESDDFYRRRLRIHRWKDRLPEAGALFPGGVSKRHLPPAGSGGLERFALETRRGELAHWMAIVPAPLFAVWNPAPLGAVMVVYACAVNLPCIAVQRYNRLRIARCRRSSAGSIASR